MTLHTLVLLWTFALTPAISPARAEDIYDAVSAATEDPAEAAALVTTWWHESQFRLSVETCAVTGDGGRSLGSFQLQRHFRGGFSRRDFCTTPSLQAQLALHALRRCQGSGDLRTAFARYTGHRRGDDEVARRIATFRRLKALAAGGIP